MEPLALAASVIQLLDFSTKLVTQTSAAYESWCREQYLRSLMATGFERSSFIEKAHDAESQIFQKHDGHGVSGLPHFKCLPTRDFLCTTWKQTSNHLPELNALVVELHSLQNTLCSLKEAMDCQLGEKEMANTRLEDQLKMVSCACEEICARANKAMAKMDCTRKCTPSGPFVIKSYVSAVDRLDRDFKVETSALRSFSSWYRLATLVSKKDSAKPRPSDEDLNSEAGTEKQSIAVNKVETDIMQQALSIRDRVRVAMPDPGSLHQIGDASDVLCFLLGTLACPPLIWPTFQSLKLEPTSLLDQHIIELMPFTATLVRFLSRHTIMALTIMTSSITISTGALAMPIWKSCPRGRSAAFVSCWLLIVTGSLVWSHMGGSIAGFFLVFIPFALGVGVASGLLWHERISHML